MTLNIINFVTTISQKDYCRHLPSLNEKNNFYDNIIRTIGAKLDKLKHTTVNHKILDPETALNEKNKFYGKIIRTVGAKLNKVKQNSKS